ncbi:uncharacterized protein J3D65DRAFT_632440 [Phyllosticta citribraziliensis]|uniref:Sacsin/Nov domain-containing protein n=1 Tax=Phyllosticta citribraziliensis TaxID=989973 RepID=A0ABR1LJL9_9PEZI
MAGVNYARMRELTLQEGQDDTVTVNTRALIDKVLARYSAEFTTLRELVQNAADAGASKVTIKFETDPSTKVPFPSDQEPGTVLRHVIKHHNLRSMDVSNNGKPFTDPDWARLRCIAEGNPDETKVGAFGVGFYSVFSECDEPFVISGNKTMAFFWKGNTLAVRSSSLPADQASSSTRFILDYRKSSEKEGEFTPSGIPDLFELSKFLTTSLTFLALESIELHVDSFKILELTKTISTAVAAAIPSHITTTSQNGIMKIRQVTHQTANIRADWSNAVAWDKSEPTQETAVQEPPPSIPSIKGFFAKFNIGTASKREQEQRAAREIAAAKQRAIAEDVAGRSQATISLNINSVNIATKVPPTLSRELLRATKKPPPQQTSLSILTTPHTHLEHLLSNAEGLTVDRAADLFASALPMKHGRVFIGFPTGQTTGYQCHIFAPSLIPTVERESIDLSNRHVSIWNESMLEIAGIACRMAFDKGMSTVKEKMDEVLKAEGVKRPTDAHVTKTIPDTVHVLAQWTAKEATPSALVGKCVEEGFWKASNRAEIMSTLGVLPCQEVRVSVMKLNFLRDLAMIPEELIEQSWAFIEKLANRRIIQYLTVEDIVQRLENKPLDEEEMREFLKFTARMSNSEVIDASDLKKLFNAAVLSTEQSIIALGSISYYLVPSKYPPELPYPITVMPLRYTKDFSRAELEGFGWNELPVEEWVRFLLDFNQRTGPKSITKDSEFATQVLKVISKQWDQMRTNQRNEVIAMLQPHAVMPTKNGMQKPQQTYHPNVKLFEDLPNLIVPGLKPRFLEALGLRQTIDLDYVFTRLLAGPNTSSSDSKPRWSHMDLIEYLTQVRDSIPQKDRATLAEKQIWPVEDYPGFRGDASKLYQLQKLHEPVKENKELGLPVIKWKSNVEYRSFDPKARFLKDLGMRGLPTWIELVEMMTQSVKEKDAAHYETILKHFVANRQQWPSSTIEVLAEKRILPVESKPFPFLVRSIDCVTNNQASIFGYNILRRDLQPFSSLLGVRRDPPVEVCANYIINTPPGNQIEAAVFFGYMAGRVADIQSSRLVAQELGSAPIVPMESPGAKKVRYIAPQSCFVGKSKEFGNILNFVDFGSISNAFLRTVGAKDHPSILELARMVIENPSRVLQELQASKYLDLLRQFAVDEKELRSDKVVWNAFRSKPVLLALKDEVHGAKAPEEKEKDLLGDDSDDDDESAAQQVMVSAAASQIAIRDNVQYYAVFRGSILIAPEDDVIEQFYMRLGAEKLSVRVQVEKIAGNPVHGGDQQAAALQKMIVERVPIFLTQYDKNQIHHDARWLERNLEVKVVSHLTHKLQLPGHRPVSLKTTAGLLRPKSRFGSVTTLYVMPQYDFYEVSRELVPLLLVRQNPKHEVLILETILSNSLRRLRDKGYDVQRILARKEKQKALMDARLAEEEKQRLAQAPVAEPPASPPVARQPPQIEAAANQPPPNPRPATPEQNKMPGGFETPSPEREKHENEITNPRRRSNDSTASGPADKLLSNLPSGWSKTIRDAFNRTTAAGGQPSSQGNNTDSRPERRRQNPNSLSSDIQSNLSAAIEKCRAHNSDSVQSSAKTKEIEEAKGSYCDSSTSTDLSRWNVTANGITVFLTNRPHDPIPIADEAFKSGIGTFANLLERIGGLFRLSNSVINIFYEDASSTIAFNKGGSLFFNYFYFFNLHARNVGGGGAADATLYWWEVFCHEIAHNLSAEHSAKHVYYEGSFVKATFRNVASLIGES